MENATYKILIVDDIEDNLKIIGNILNTNNISILFATNGKQAIKIAQKKIPDLILLDINMPEMNGYKACEFLKNKETTKHIPIIFLSALSEKDNIVKGFDVGGVDYITKPFNKSELLSRVFTHLELKHAKDLLEEKNEDLKEMNATKDKFFSIIAHDLKNPFNSLINLSDLMIQYHDKFDDAQKIKYIETINSASKSGYKLLENLLEWARLQTGRISYEPSDIDIKNIIDINLQLVQTMAHDKAIKIVSNTEKNIVAQADFNMIDTVFRNLISNALKFTNKGGEITITAKITDEIIKIGIKDTGVGIKSKNINKLFKIDESFSTTGTAKERGTGLGLILCKEFIEKNSGKIWVESQENIGSEFIFTLKKGKEKPKATLSIIDTLIYNLKQEKNIPTNLITTLKNDFLPKTKDLLLKMSINSFKEFSSDLSKLFNESNIASLIEYSKSLSEAVKLLDISIIAPMLKKLPDLVNALEE